MTTPQPRLSDKPYYAEIAFKDGTKRIVDYALMNASSVSLTFFSNKDGTGPMLVVNFDTVQTIECNETTQTVGAA